MIKESTHISGRGIDKSSSTTVTTISGNTTISRTFKEPSFRGSAFSSLSVFSIVLVVLLVASITTNLILGDTHPLTFSSLLEYMQGAPSISYVFQEFETIPLQTDWGFFDFLLPLVNVLVTVWNFVITLVRLLLQVLKYFLYIILFFFPASGVV